MLGAVQSEYLKASTELWNQTLHSTDAVAPSDRRFSARDWGNPASAYVAQMYPAERPHDAADGRQHRR